MHIFSWQETMATGTGSEFVEGWLVAQVLGEGAYGEWVFLFRYIWNTLILYVKCIY